MSIRAVPKKNYYLLIIMIVAIIILTFAVVNVVKQVKNNHVSSGYINKYVSELQYEELENYLIEPANNTFIYLTFTADEDVYNLETKLKKVINNYELQSNFIYVDVTDEMNDANFLEKLNKKFGVSETIKNVPVILYYKDGILVDSVQGTSSIFTVADFQRLLDNYEIAS